MKRWKERTEGGGGRSGGGGGRGFSSRSDRCDCYCGYTHKQPSWVICSAMYKHKDTSAHLYLIISHREHTSQGREPAADIKPNNRAAERCTNTHMHIKQNYNGWNGLLLYALVKGEELYKPGVLRPNTLCVCIHVCVFLGYRLLMTLIAWSYSWSCGSRSLQQPDMVMLLQAVLCPLVDLLKSYFCNLWFPMEVKLKLKLTFYTSQKHSVKFYLHSTKSQRQQEPAGT